ncbi:MAG: hypothetical protein HY308_04285 [Gammaproteobacteria bacterium]|nr:hypothetical protein [Gammaproteobacteria bacterium]
MQRLIVVYEPHSGGLFPCIESDDDSDLLTACDDLPVAHVFDEISARRYSRDVLHAAGFRVAGAHRN